MRTGKVGAASKKVARAFPSQGAAIVFSVNSFFAKYLAVMIQSIIDHASSDELYDIVVLMVDIEDEIQKKLLLQISERNNFSLRFINVGDRLKGKRFFTENATRITDETYFRLLIPELFSEYERAVYLDADMITRVDIALLFHVSFDGMPLISSRDLWGICNCYKPDDPLNAYRRDLVGAENINDYFIAGLLIFNLNSLDAESTGRMLDVAVGHDWLQHDQDVLNKLFVGKTKLIDASWDFMEDIYNEIKSLPARLQDEYSEAAKDPKIVHFGGQRKPWSSAFRDYDLSFWEAAKKTPFFDEIFFGMRGRTLYKGYLIGQLFEEGITLEHVKNNIRFRFRDRSIGSFSGRTLCIDFLKIDNGLLLIEGYCPRHCLAENEQLRICLRNGDILYESCPSNLYADDHRRSGEIIWTGEPFLFRIPVEEFGDLSCLSFVAVVGNTTIFMKRIWFDKFCALANTYLHSYQYADGYVLSSMGSYLKVEKADEAKRDEYEHRFLRQLSSRDDYEQVKRLRMATMTTSPERPIWLFSDRTNKADDNGEALFAYACKHKDELGVDPWFILRDDSPDYERISKIGNVVPYLSEKHKLLHLLCECNFSAQADLESFNPFGVDEDFCRDLLQTQKFIFLQHGVLISDISRWGNRANINPWLFVASAERERNSILETEKYSMDDSVVKITGLPRHDRLHDAESARWLVIMPTWRKWLCERPPENLGVWTMREGFEKTPYYHFYNALLTDERLILAAEEYGYGLCFMPHPNIQDGIDAFTHDPRVSFLGVDTSYCEVFSKSELVVTDYSSSVHDFSYMRKPVVYVQFDKDDFNAGVHTSKMSYFDWERDGFGEVVYNREDLVELLIDYMRSGCQMKQKYLERVNSFFEFNDHESCKRVIAAVEEKKKHELEEAVLSSRADISGLEPLPKKTPDLTGGVSSAISKAAFERACARFGISSAERSKYAWGSRSRSSLSAFELIPCVSMELAKKEKLCIPNFEQLSNEDVQGRFINHFMAIGTNSLPYVSDRWDAPLDTSKLGYRWTEINVRKKPKALKRGDIVCFANGKAAIVVSNKKGQIVFITCKKKRYGALVRVGSLSGFSYPSDINKLPEISWVIRKTF